MQITVLRLPPSADFMLSALYIGAKLQCLGVEDEPRAVKVPGETAIPDGSYEMRFRTVGKMHQSYLAKFGDVFHKGMLEVCDVPNFTAVLHHIGNTDDNTEGCYLVGRSANISGFIAESTSAYKDYYPQVRDALLRGEKVTITYRTIKL